MYDLSDGTFSIQESSTPSITVTSPNGGENWEPGSAQYITWYASNVSSVVIDLYVEEDNADLTGTVNTYLSTISSYTSNDGSYAWSIPSSQNEANNYKILIREYGSNGMYDLSDGTFSIQESSTPSITVTSPNGGEEWEPGSSHSITWSSSNLPGSNVGIQLFSSGSLGDVYVSSISSSTTDDGSYNWSISSSEPESDYYLVKIYSTSESSISDYSDSNFTIQESSTPTIIVTSPNGGEEWEPGSSHSITWSSNDLPGSYVGIQLYKNGSYSSSISSSTNDDGSYTWSISSGQTESDYYQIRIYSTTNSSIYDLSNDYFTIDEATSSSCNTPTNLQSTNITTTSVVLDWDPSSGAISYNVMYREYGDSWDMATDITTSAANWSGLSPNTTYQWQVQTDCGSTSSSWSSTIIFTTLDDGGSGAHCDEPYYCSDCAGCEGNCCPNYCSGNYYYYNRSCSNGFCVGSTSDYCPNGCNDDGCL
jgi:hypothetical protein